MKNIGFTQKAWTDFLDWSTSDPKLFAKIVQLIEATSRTPFDGIGKPEPLKNQLHGLWSRRINEKHRLVYRVKEDEIQIISCKYHY